MITFEIIPSEELSECINAFDAKINFLKAQFNIELKTYSNVIRIALNAIQSDIVDNLIEKIKINKELERELDNAGGYSIDFLTYNNPKDELLKLLTLLKETMLKQNRLINYLQNLKEETILIVDLNDVDFFKQKVKNNKLSVIPFSALKKIVPKGKSFLFYSFNGTKDFDCIYNLDAKVLVIGYEQEYQLYQKQISLRKRLIENEIKSDDRLKISGLTYIDTPEVAISLSNTVEEIVNRLDNLSNRAYEVYKDESDILLNELEEKIVYKLTSSEKIFWLDSNDTIFLSSGDITKAYKVKVGEHIRIYPKEQFAENLYQVAVETEPEIFGKVESHSLYWKQTIIELRKKYGDDALYAELKKNGLKVLSHTLETYGKSFQKFPMYNNDIRAIIKLSLLNKDDEEIDVIIKPILKSKTTYNSTMIALGRGLKQELKLFLKEKQLGEILKKRNFNMVTLQKFIDDFMPLLTILTKEIHAQNVLHVNIQNFDEQIDL